jgi:hypothetical protein
VTIPAPEPPASHDSEDDGELTTLQYLWAHIGMISGVILGLIVFAFVAFLAIKGYEPAITLIIFIVGFFGLIALGGRLFQRMH